MSAAIVAREEAPHPTFVRVLAGEFRADADYATYRRQGTDDWLLIHTISGSGRIAGSTGYTLTAPGDAVLLRPGQLHDYSATAEGWRLAFAHFHPRPDWLGLMDWPLRAGDIRAVTTRPEQSAQVRAHLRRAAALHGVGPSTVRSAELAAINALESALLALDSGNTTNVRPDERIRDLIDHITQHLDRPLGLDTLAELVHLSPSHVSRLFRDAVGETPQHYIERLRMQRAALLLSVTDLAIAEVARQTGWSDPLYFSRRFRHHFGTTPTLHRQARSA